MTEQESWKPVAWAPDYDVSDLGRVRSWKAGRDKEPRILKPTYRRGYCRVFLIASGEKAKAASIHRLVLDAFVGPRPDLEGRHINDFDRTNNRLANLKWGTAKENSEDRNRHGRTARGERMGPAKLTERDVIMIRGSQETNLALARKLGVGEKTVADARRGVQWKHVKAG